MKMEDVLSLFRRRLQNLVVLSSNINVPIFPSQVDFGETLNPISSGFLFHHDTLNERTLPMRHMNNATQEFSKELRDESYSCAFCDSVSRKYEQKNVPSALESLYLEHLGKYHGLTQ